MCFCTAVTLNVVRRRCIRRVSVEIYNWGPLVAMTWRRIAATSSRSSRSRTIVSAASKMTKSATNETLPNTVMISTSAREPAGGVSARGSLLESLLLARAREGPWRERSRRRGRAERARQLVFKQEVYIGDASVRSGLGS